MTSQRKMYLIFMSPILYDGNASEHSYKTAKPKRYIETRKATLCISVTS